MPLVAVIVTAVLVGAELSTIVIPVIATILVALIGGAYAFKSTRHTASGEIKSSTATDLWAESKALRDEYRAEVITLRGDVKNLRTALDNSLEREGKLRERVAVLEYELAQLKDAS